MLPSSHGSMGAWGGSTGAWYTAGMAGRPRTKILRAWEAENAARAAQGLPPLPVPDEILSMPRFSPTSPHTIALRKEKEALQAEVTMLRAEAAGAQAVPWDSDSGAKAAERAKAGPNAEPTLSPAEQAAQLRARLESGEPLHAAMIECGYSQEEIEVYQGPLAPTWVRDLVSLQDRASAVSWLRLRAGAGDVLKASETEDSLEVRAAVLARLADVLKRCDEASALADPDSSTTDDQLKARVQRLLGNLRRDGVLH